MKKKLNNKKKMDKKKYLVVFLLILLLIVNLTFSFIYFGLLKNKELSNDQDTGLDSRREKIEEFQKFLDEAEILSLDDFVEIEVDLSREGFIILKDKEDKCSGMIVAIDPNQAVSIQHGIESKFTFRPSSHDTIRDIIEHYNIKVIMVKITELKGGAYLGRLLLTDEKKILNLDIKPSDGIAIAVRTASPIYLSKGLIEEQGINLCKK